MLLTVHQFEALITELPNTKKLQLLRFISKQLGEPVWGIEKNLLVCGGSACIIRTRIPVWTLVSFKKMGLSETDLLISYPTLRLQDLKNAWAYYKSNKKEIEIEIEQNQAN